MVTCQFIGGGTGTAVTSTVTDTLGNTYTNFGGAQINGGDNSEVQMFYAISSSTNASDAIACNYATSSNFAVVGIDQYGGVVQTNPLDVSNTTQWFFGTGATSTAFTTTNANDVIVAAVGDDTNQTHTAGTNYTMRLTGSVQNPFEDWIATSTQTNATANMSGPGNTHAVMVIGAFKAADLTPPSVTIVSPTSGSIVSSTITLSVSSTDNVGVAGVQFQIDGTNLGSEVTATSGPTIYSTTWNTASSTDSSHTISAIAYDSSNNSSTATSSVTVHNALLNVTTSTSLSFSATSGDTATSSQVIVIQNTGTASSTLSWTSTSTQSWLTLSSTSGSLAGSTTSSLLLIADPSGLSAATYTATATITDSNLSSSYLSLPITFTIAASSTPAPETLPAVGVASAYGIPTYWLLPSSTDPTSGDTAASSSPASSPTSLASLQATLASLEAKLQSLLAEAESQGITIPNLPASVSSPQTPFSFTRNLSLWDQGSDVEALQQFLVTQNTGPHAQKLKSHGTTQFFGFLTHNALKEYQASVGLPATGYFGEMTRNHLHSQAGNTK